MPKNNINTELRSLDEEQLKAKLVDTKLQLKKLKFSHAIQPVENPMRMRAMRRDIARISTELTKRKVSK